MKRQICVRNIKYMMQNTAHMQWPQIHCSNLVKDTIIHYLRWKHFLMVVFLLSG